MALSDINTAGYKRITLYNPIRKRFFVHRLVAYHFCEGYKENLVVNHKDGNKQNNRSDNLEWVTRSENDLHAFKNGLRKLCGNAVVQKEKSKRKVLVKSINTNNIEYIFKDYKECAKYFNLSETYIKECCRGKYKLRKKYIAYYE